MKRSQKNTVSMLLIRTDHSYGQAMNKEQTIWIHPATYTYRLEQPEKEYASLWVSRPGWGYLMRTDFWIRSDSTEADLKDRGFIKMAPETDPAVAWCPHCGMYVNEIPGYLLEDHIAACGGSGENHLAMEDQMISDIRAERHALQVIERLRLEAEEAEYAERRERFDRIKEEAAARQSSKDRKKRMKAELREQIKRK